VTWQTIVVCGACYRVRHDTDDQLVDRPVRLREHTELCHDCGGEGADIPIRANTTTHNEKEDE
jgi:hypothetical protein